MGEAPKADKITKWEGGPRRRGGKRQGSRMSTDMRDCQKARVPALASLIGVRLLCPFHEPQLARERARIMIGCSKHRKQVEAIVAMIEELSEIAARIEGG
jgi:hypothetical protein